MLARGFDGRMPVLGLSAPAGVATWVVAVACVAPAAAACVLAATAGTVTA
jgi:predicted polyphosphate/ATP-dependent NAD kinase